MEEGGGRCRSDDGVLWGLDEQGTGPSRGFASRCRVPPTAHSVQGEQHGKIGLGFFFFGWV